MLYCHTYVKHKDRREFSRREIIPRLLYGHILSYFSGLSFHIHQEQISHLAIPSIDPGWKPFSKTYAISCSENRILTCLAKTRDAKFFPGEIVAEPLNRNGSAAPDRGGHAARGSDSLTATPKQGITGAGSHGAERIVIFLLHALSYPTIGRMQALN